MVFSELLIDRIMRVSKQLHTWFHVDGDAIPLISADGKLNVNSNYHVKEIERVIAALLGRIGFLYPSMQLALPITVAGFEACLNEICTFLQQTELVYRTFTLSFLAV
jgi:hypothetical protein